MATTQRGINIPVTGQFQDGDDIVAWAKAFAYSADAAIGRMQAVDNQLTLGELESIFPTAVESEPRQTGMLVMPPAFVPVIGSPAPGMVLHTPTLLYDDSAQEEARFTFQPPAWWTSVNVKIIWLHGNAAPANVRWRLRVGYATEGGFAEPGSAQDSTIAADPQYRLLATDLGDHTIDPSRLCLITIGRIGNSSLDTHTGDVGLAYVRLTQDNA